MRVDVQRMKEVMEALAAPFDADEVKSKPQAISKDGTKALPVFFVDARAIMQRLDDILGLDGWKDAIEFQHDGTVKCILSIRIDDGEWISREDVGGQSEQPDNGDRVKSAVSDALKRVAVKFGLGRYLYAVKPTWLDYDSQTRKFKTTPTIPVYGGARSNPTRGSTAPRPSTENGAGRDPVMPRNGAELQARLKAKDDKLAQDQKIQPGDLIRSVILAGKEFNLPEDISKWDQTQFGVAVEAAAKFVKSL